jgi:hypothetical protein
MLPLFFMVLVFSVLLQLVNYCCLNVCISQLVTFITIIVLGTHIITHNISMDVSSRVVYTSGDLFKLRARSTSNSSGHAVLSTIKHLGLLHYRRSCAGARRANLIPMILTHRRVAGSGLNTRNFMNERHVVNTTTAKYAMSDFLHYVMRHLCDTI